MLGQFAVEPNKANDFQFSSTIQLPLEDNDDATMSGHYTDNCLATL